MNTTALITEYNPFHNGHQYHLNKSLKITQADQLIVIMSGNFTQRGDAALIDKWARTEQALSCGADLVLELPFIYNIRSAEYFAYYSILSLEKSNIVDSIVFGSEAGNIELISAIAEALVNEKPDFQNQLQNYLKTGLDFPTSRRKALIDSYQSHKNLKKFSRNKIKKALKAPNNILGIEYLKALFKLNSKIKAQTINRIGTDYHSQKTKNNYASASLIRSFFNSKSKNEALAAAQNLMPKKAWKILRREIEKGRFVDSSFQNEILTKTVDQLRRYNSDELKKYKGLKNGLENRFIEKAESKFKANTFLESLKSKNLTESSIKRKILQIYFGLKAEKINKVENNAPHYLRVLGIKNGKESLLSKLQNQSNLELIINPAEKINQINLETDKALELSLSFDILATNLYSLLYQNPEHSKANRDFHQKLIKK